MAIALQLGNRTITPDEIIPLLAQYQMLPQLIRETLLDQAIADVSCTSEETISACQQFWGQHQLTTPAKQEAWLTKHCLTLAEFLSLATRQLKIEKFKQATWGNKLESYFLNRKQQLDKVIYSMILVQDMGVAQELYFRIQEGEQSFAELAQTYSQGPESQTSGLIGPTELERLTPALAHILSTSQPGQLSPPIPWGEWVMIVRLEKWLPAQMDDVMRQRLLNELFEFWLQQQFSEIH